MNKLRVKVPGSVMLMGEHSVLFGYNALACAIDQYITITLTPTVGEGVRVNSSLGSYQSNLSDLVPSKTLSFAVATIQYFKSQLITQNKTSFQVDITSTFSSTVGLGSSAAVSVGLVAVLSAYLENDISYSALFKDTLCIVQKQQQGRGSGTDIAASLYGGMIEYNLEQRVVQTIDKVPFLTLYYSGYKTKTADVLSLVEKKAQQYPDIYRALYRLMGEVTRKASHAILLDDWPKVGELMTFYQGLMSALGVSDKVLSEIISQLIICPQVLGAKISGSGLGDCVITLSQTSSLVDLPNYQSIDINVSKKGLQWL